MIRFLILNTRFEEHRANEGIDAHNTQYKTWIMFEACRLFTVYHLQYVQLLFHYLTSHISFTVSYLQCCQHCPLSYPWYLTYSILSLDSNSKLFIIPLPLIYLSCILSLAPVGFCDDFTSGISFAPRAFGGSLFL